MSEKYFENLLQTKIYTPTLREDYVTRTRLLDRLDNVEAGQAILVKAPAGYGKTTLIVDWLERINVDHAWYAVDRRDNDLAQFLTYIIFSLHQLASGVCTRTLERIHSPDPPPTQRLLDYLINDLTCLREQTYLVIDDYHLIANPDIHDAVSYLLHNCPPQLQLVLLSREDLPFPITTLRARNRLLELDFFDLRFTIKEADSFLKKAFNIELPFDKVVEIDNQVEGWVTGLQLAGLSLRHREDKEDFLSYVSGEDQLIQRFLFEEVLLTQSEDVQDFLVKTSILDRLSAPLCNHLLQIEHSQRILERLEEANLFIIPLDNRQEIYRYHHVFAEALQKRLRRTQPGVIPALYQRAAEWHEEQGNIEEAIEYALQGEDYPKAAVYIQGIVNQVIREGGRRRILRWLSSIPETMLREHFMLWAHLITAHLGLGEFTRARDSLHSLWGKEEHFAGLDDRERRQVQGLKAGFLASIEIHTTLNIDEVYHLSQTAMDLYPRDVDFGRSIGPGYHAVANYHMGNIPRAKGLLDQALKLSKRHAYSRLEFLWICYRAQIELDAGDLQQAEAYLNQALNIARQMGVQESNVVSNVIIGLGRLHYERDRLDEAGTFLRDGIQIARSAFFMDHVIWGYQIYLRYLMASGAFEEAWHELKAAREIAAALNHPPFVLEQLSALKACVDIQSGQIDAVAAWAGEQEDWREADALGKREYKWLTLGRAWLAVDKPQKSRPLFRALVEEADENQRGRGLVEASIHLARACIQLGDLSPAREHLLRALDFAEPYGYVRSFLDSGREIWSLLQKMYVEEGGKVQQRTGLKSYLRRLLAAFESEGKRLEELGIDFGCAPRDELLTDREGDIVSLLAQGMSYAEIATTLSISENTVKTHIKNLYRKLQVNNRTEAVNRARSLQIL